MGSIICDHSSTPSAVPGKAAAALLVPAIALDAGQSCTPIPELSASAPSKQPAGCCSNVTAWSSATCWPARAISRSGARCSWRFAGWKREEIRGGRFVDGFLGEQFALPIAVESLRANRKLPPAGEVVTISAADPLNLIGIVVPGERIPAISGRTVTYRDGVALEAEPGLQTRVVAI